jgi:hypothetical protein
VEAAGVPTDRRRTMDDREENIRFVEGLNAGWLLGVLKLIP